MARITLLNTKATFYPSFCSWASGMFSNEEVNTKVLNELKHCECNSATSHCRQTFQYIHLTRGLRLFISYLPLYRILVVFLNMNTNRFYRHACTLPSWKWQMALAVRMRTVISRHINSVKSATLNLLARILRASLLF